MTSVYTFTDEQLLHAVNKALIVSIEGIMKEGYINQEQAENICINYSLILESKKWIPSFLSKLLDLQDDGIKLRLVKAVGRNDK